jgi:hypothetical protein
MSLPEAVGVVPDDRARADVRDQTSPRMRRSAVARLLLGSVLSILSALTTAAQTHPAVERGFRAEQTYDFNGFDSVSMANGNINATIPLGGSFPVGEGLSYSFSVHYSGNLWNKVVKENQTDPALPPRIWYVIRGEDNAGLGWNLSFGALYPGGTTKEGEYNTNAAKWRYVSPDGAEHVFWGRCTSHSASME